MLKFGSLSELYKGITDCFVRVIKDEGMLALWRGHTVNCARILPDLEIISRGCSKKERDGYWRWFASNLASGGAAGATSLLFVFSVDYARTRCERQFNGLINVYRKALKSDGIASLYRGFTVSCVGIIVYRRLYFGLNDSLKPVVFVGKMQAITIGAGLASKFFRDRGIIARARAG
ncbi:hypothetical protein ACJRO7_012525 [Eucalyptus globulus]|uniref:ADP/ATP translocase n=1 Tax=Eucalyptus globulus TaxID=34317 RepID=A0ABD3LK07_EUCGL